MSGKLKNKFKPKPRKGAVKRLKVTGGSSPLSGKLTIGRINSAHRQINKPRQRKLRAVRSTTLGKSHRKYQKALSVNN